MIKLSSITGWASGLNWYKYGIILALLLGWTVAVHMRATSNCELAHQEQLTEQAEAKTVAVIDEITARVPVVQQRDQESAALRNKIKTLEGQLYEAINQKPDSAECDLSDDELLYFQELAKAQ